MRKLISQTLVSSAGPQSVFTLAAGSPSVGFGLVVIVNGQISPHYMTSAASLTLRTPAPARAIVDMWEDDQSHMPINVAEAALDFPSIPAGSAATLAVTVQGAMPGNVVQVGYPLNIPSGVTYDGWVSAANTVTVRAMNFTAAAIDPPVGTFKVLVK